MPWIIVAAVLVIVLAVIIVVWRRDRVRLSVELRQMQDAVAMAQEQAQLAKMLAPTQQDELLRELLCASASADSEESAKGIIRTLLSSNLHLSYVSLFMWSDSRAEMTLLNSNVAYRYWGALLPHIAEIQKRLDASGSSIGDTRHSEEGLLSYATARERHICFSYYIPLYRGHKKLGALLVESRDRHCAEVLDLHFFQLVVDNISVVLYNILLMQRVLQQANTDHLTKLYNRTYLEEYSKKLENLGTCYSVVMSDIDFFKKCNDTYGHAVGDLVLSCVAQVFNDSIRHDFDGAFRYGGEEFTLIFRDVSTKIVETRAEQIRQVIEQSGIVYDDDGSMLNITLSLGICHCTGGEPVAETIKKADNALYYAKEHGRNQVHVYQEPKTEPAEMSVGAGVMVKRA